MKISVVGLGYVGLSLASLLSTRNNVTALDVDKTKVDLINKNQSPINDSEYIEFFKNNKLNLVATLDKNVAYKDAEIIIVCVPTNYIAEQKKFDTTLVEEVIKDINSINKNALVVIKSTAPVGFSKRIAKEFDNPIVFSPEFLRETKAIFDNQNPSRIIVGLTKKNKQYINKVNKFVNLLRDISVNNPETLLMNSSEAESVKLFSNTYLALRVAFFNELDSFAEARKLNSKDIVNGVCLDPRIQDMYNNPSFGYGGYCLPKDTKELKANYKNVPETLISTIIKSNDKRKKFITNQIIKNLKDKNGVVGVYRLSMKSNSDNIRESSIIDVINGLVNKGIKVVVYEPLIKLNNNLNLTLINDLNEFKSKSNIIIANRYNHELDDAKEKVYTRDIFGRD